MNAFSGPMLAFPGLERWSRELELPPGRAWSDLRLHLYDTGGNVHTPVLLLHGLGDEADTWRHVLPRVSGSRRVIAPDLPGFGRSDQGKHAYTIPFFVEMVRALLDALALPRVVLAGHSTGGIIAHAFALAHPERVERLVLIGGSLVARDIRVDRSLLFFLLPGLGEWMYKRLRNDPQAAYRSLEPYYHRLEDLPQADRDFLYRRVNQRVWSDGQRRGFLATLRGLAAWLPRQQKDLPERLKDWQIPTTVIWGAEDAINSKANALALAELLPTARVILVEGAGHNVQQEKPEAVARELALTRELAAAEILADAEVPAGAEVRADAETLD